MQNWGVVHLGHIGASAVAKGCDLLKGKTKYLKRNLTESILTFNKNRSTMTDFYLSIHPVYPLSYPPQINVDYENRLILVVNHLSTPYIFGRVYIDFGDAIIGNKLWYRKIIALFMGMFELKPSLMTQEGINQFHEYSAYSTHIPQDISIKKHHHRCLNPRE